MSFFILPQYATLLKRVDPETYDRSGQMTKPEHAATGVRFKCLFYGIVGGKTGGARQDFDQTIAFYCEPGVDISEGDLITNISGVESFESGPFEVLRVTKVTSFSGRVHHQSCKLRGSVK